MSAPIPSNEDKRLEALRRYNLLDTAPEQSFDDFVYLASHICGTPIASITFIDSDRQWFKAQVGLTSSQTPREQAFCAHTIMAEGLLIVEDATEDARFAANPLVTSDPNIRFYAGAPLVDRDGFGLGSLCVIDRKPRQLSEPDQRALEALARRVVDLVEYRRISSDLAEALTEVKTLRGLLPICAHCKSVKNDGGYWKTVEDYLCALGEVELSHCVCPACLKELYPKVYEKLAAQGRV